MFWGRMVSDTINKTFIRSQRTQRKQNGELSELNELY